METTYPAFKNHIFYMIDKLMSHYILYEKNDKENFTTGFYNSENRSILENIEELYLAFSTNREYYLHYYEYDRSDNNYYRNIQTCLKESCSKHNLRGNNYDVIDKIVLESCKLLSFLYNNEDDEETDTE